MKMSFTSTRRKRAVLLVSTLFFLLQSIVPAFQGAMARTVDGYTETVCTMYGPKTIFIVLDDKQEKRNSRCPECSVCVLQANLNGVPETCTLLIDVRYLLDSRGENEPLYLASNPLFFPRFLSRAPPV
jgi:hypothetical protein